MPIIERGPIITRRIARQAYQLSFFVIAGVLLAISAYRLTALVLVPEITIGYASSEPQVGALFRALSVQADPSAVSIRVSELPDADGVDAAFVQKKIDLAAVQPTNNFPANAMVAAILNSTPLFFVTWEASKIKRADQLAGQRIVVAGLNNDAYDALRKLMAHYAGGEARISNVGVDIAAIKAEIASKRIDALVAADVSFVKQLLGQIAEFKPALIPISAADASKAAPGLGAFTVPAKSLVNGLPEEDVETASVNVLLVARKDVDRAVVSTVLQNLFSIRPLLARENPIAWDMKGPTDDSTFAKLPNHRGALDYYNREQQTFMDQYGDWIWLGLFAAGGVSSAGAWLTQTLSRRRKQLVENILDRLIEILGEAREAKDVAALDKLTLEVDGLVIHAIRQARWRATELTTTSALALAISSSRAAIADQRTILWRHQPVDSPVKAERIAARGSLS